MRLLIFYEHYGWAYATDAVIIGSTYYTRTVMRTAIFLDFEVFVDSYSTESPLSDAKRPNINILYVRIMYVVYYIAYRVTSN